MSRRTLDALREYYERTRAMPDQHPDMHKVKWENIRMSTPASGAAFKYAPRAIACYGWGPQAPLKPSRPVSLRGLNAGDDCPRCSTKLKCLLSDPYCPNDCDRPEEPKATSEWRREYEGVPVPIAAEKTPTMDVVWDGKRWVQGGVATLFHSSATCDCTARWQDEGVWTCVGCGKPLIP